MTDEAISPLRRRNDRRHDDAQVSAEDATRLHPHHQEPGPVPRPLAGHGSFEPQLIAKGQTRFDGFDDKILSLYARGMTVREIQGHLAELYGTEVSPDLISRVTDAIPR